MPRWDFDCKKDGEFEAIVSWTDTEAECPVCKKMKPRISRVYPMSIVYTGEGFTKKVPDGDNV